VQGLISSGVAKGGMQAKLNAAVSAVTNGVQDVCIVSGQRAGAIADLLGGSIRGTRLSAMASEVLQ